MKAASPEDAAPPALQPAAQSATQPATRPATRPAWRVGPALLLGLLLLATLPLGVTGLWQLRNFERSLRSSATDNLVGIARKKVAEINAYLDDVQTDAQVVAQAADARDLLAQGRGIATTRVPPAGRVFFERLQDLGKYRNLLLVQPDGRISFALKPLTNPAPGVDRLDVPGLADGELMTAHRRALGQLDVQLTPLVRLSGESQDTLFLVHPVVDAGRVLGTIVLELDLPRLLRLASDRAGLALTGETVLVRRHGGQAYFVGNGLRMSPELAARALDPLAVDAVPAVRGLRGESGSGLATNYAGIEVISSWRHLPALDWGIAVNVDAREAFAPVRTLRNRLLAGLAFALLASLGLALLLARRMLKPVAALNQAVARIAGGSLDERAPVYGFAEFRELARNFNDMTEQLVVEKQLLEARVEQRTRALHDSEQRFRGIFERSQVGIALCDAQGLVLEVNQALTAMLCRTGDELRGAKLADLPDFRSGRRPGSELERLASGRLAHVRFERGFALPGGGELFVDGSASAIRDPRGRIVNIVQMLIDVTERHRTEIELVRARVAAESASRAKSDFLANMSHEIRTPMSGALGMLNLLLRTELTPRQHDYAAKARTAAQALLAVINDVLDFSKVEAGKLELDPQRFELSEFMRELAVILSANVGSKEVEVLFRVDPRLPPALVGDATRLRQVLLNLAGNALKFTEQGEVVLAVTLVAQEAAGAGRHLRIRFEVTDSGIGIPADKLEHIFTGFSQAEQSTSRRYGGTGLGLAISRKLVALMGGELAVDSVLGEGSRFHFELRLPEAPVEPPDERARACASRPGLKVLIVDDNPMAREVLQGIGESLGWVCDVAASGEQALELVHRAAQAGQPRYELILMDWRMPGLDGWETSRRIRDSHESDAPLIIMVTAYGRELLADRSEQEIASLGGYLVKPVTASALVDVVGEVISPVARQPRAEGGGQRLAGMRLLVVEDNGFNQQVAQELLEAEGAVVTLAGGGVEGAQLAGVTEPPFDAILMDLQMPDIDGFEATRRILKRRPRSRVIAMTANAMQTDRQACLAAGMLDHVAKPVDLDQLIVCLRRHAGAPPNLLPERFRPPEPPAVVADTARSMVLLDRDAALQRLGGRQPLYDRLIAAFVQDGPDQMQVLRQALQQGVAPDVQRALHTLRGLAGTVGAVALAAAAGEQELALRDGGDGGDWAAVNLAMLQRLLDDTLAMLVPMDPAPR